MDNRRCHLSTTHLHKGTGIGDIILEVIFSCCNYTRQEVGRGFEKVFIKIKSIFIKSKIVSNIVWIETTTHKVSVRSLNRKLFGDSLIKTELLKLKSVVENRMKLVS